VIFVIHETWRVLSNMRGKLLLTILLLTASGILTGLLYTLYYNTSVIHHSFQRQLRGEIFLQDDCSEEQRTRLEAQLERDTLVQIDHFRSREEARALFAAEFGEEIFEVLEENPLPASFLVHFRHSVTEGNRLQTFESTYDALPGVLSVRVPSRMLQLLHERVTFLLQSATVLLAVLLTGTVLLVIYSTRQAVSHYWPEIDTMLLMGAGPGKIRLPFLTGSLFYSLLAGGIGHLLLLLAVSLIRGLGYHVTTGGAIWLELALLLGAGFGGTLLALNAGLRHGKR